jgi:lipid-binding SYLF domain-containing protein
MLALISAVPLSMVAAEDKAALQERLEHARAVIDEIMQAPDKGIPEGVMRKATCVAVIPSVKKGAFILGAEYGQGVVTCRNEHGWSAPAFIRLAGGSVGFQWGAEGTDLVLVAVNDKGMQDLLKDKIKIGADASAAAGPVGRDAQAATDIKLNAELLTYSRSKGLLAGIDLGGASIAQNEKANEVFYGTAHPLQQILRGEVRPPRSAEPFVETVARYSGAAQVSEKR